MEPSLGPDFAPPNPPNLGPATRNILRNMARVLLPRNERLNVGHEEEIVNFVDSFVLYLPPLLRLGFPLGVWAFQLASIILSGRFVPYTWLSPERQEAYMAGWTHSNLWWRRDLIKGVKALMMLGFYEIPEVQKFLNYDQAGHVNMVKARRLASYAHEI